LAGLKGFGLGRFRKISEPEIIGYLPDIVLARATLYANALVVQRDCARSPGPGLSISVVRPRHQTHCPAMIADRSAYAAAPFESQDSRKKNLPTRGYSEIQTLKTSGKVTLVLWEARGAHSRRMTLPSLVLGIVTGSWMRCGTYLLALFAHILLHSLELFKTELNLYPSQSARHQFEAP
jgi:hypothetical protein